MERRHGRSGKVRSKSWELPLVACPRVTSGVGHTPGWGFGPGWELPLLPVLAVGTRAGHAPPLLPRLGLPGQGLLHLQLDLGGAQPTDGQVVSGNVLHRQLLLPCWGKKGVVQERRPRLALLSLLDRLRKSQ